MRASRLLSVLLLLQTRGRMTARALAEELEVSVRTIYRDVDALTAAGVPLYAEAGPSGGYEILAGYRTRLTGLTTSEAESLFLTGVPGAAAELGLGTALAATELKLLAALPPELRERAARARDRLHVDVPGWFAEADDTPHLPDIAAAVQSDRVIEVRYRRWAPTVAVVTRRLRPLGLVVKAGRWYLVAAHDEGGDPRTYRVSSVTAITVTERTFTRPEGFSLRGFWTEAARRYERDVLRETAVARLSPSGLAAAATVFGPAQRAALVVGATDADGWHEITIPIESVEHATGQFLALRAEAEVLAPAALRTCLAETVAAMAARYAPVPIS